MNRITDPAVLAALNAVPVLFFPDKEIRGNAKEEDWSHPEVLFADILVQPWPAEVCFTQYHHSKRTRINLDEKPPSGLSFNLVALDIDTSPHLPITDLQWEQAIRLSALMQPVPNLLYRTWRGVRCIYLIEPMADPLVFEASRMKFLASAGAVFARTKGWKVDATSNWNAFFRAPRVMYRDEKSGFVIDLRDAPIWLWHTNRIALPVVVPPPVIHATPPSKPTGPGLGAAMDWLRSQAPAIEGQDGDKRTYWILRELVWTFGLDDLAVLEAIEEWNSRCEPPWGEDQLLRKLTYARKKKRKPHA